MDIKILDEPLDFDLYGLSGDVASFDYAGSGKKLMDELWRRVREHSLPHKGKNFWVYHRADHMSSCVELKDGASAQSILVHLPVSLQKYAYFKHVGLYKRLGEVHREMDAELRARGLVECGPRIEKYGDWVEDENQLVTEVFIGLN